MASTDCFRQTHLGPLVILVLWLAGCVPYQQLARQQDLQQQLLPGERFLHRIFTNTAARCATPASRWHVYIEGDGHAVTPQGRPAADPTPRSPLLLPMMASKNMQKWQKEPEMYSVLRIMFDLQEGIANGFLPLYRLVDLENNLHIMRHCI